MTIFLEGSLTFFFAGRSVIGDVSHVTFFVVTVVAFNGTIVHRFFNLNEQKNKRHNNEFLKVENVLITPAEFCCNPLIKPLSMRYAHDTFTTLTSLKRGVKTTPNLLCCSK